MENKPPDFLQFIITYTRQGNSNKWVQKIKREMEPKKTGTPQSGIPRFFIYHEGGTEKDAKRIEYSVNVPCDSLLNDPKTLVVPESLISFEIEALEISDKDFKKIHPEAEIISPH